MCKDNNNQPPRGGGGLWGKQPPPRDPDSYIKDHGWVKKSENKDEGWTIWGNPFVHLRWFVS
jgi:hypothetical protein